MPFLLLLSCSQNGTDTGNPVVSLKINGSSNLATVARNDFWQKVVDFLVPVATAAPASISDASSRTIILSALWTTMAEIEFETEASASPSEVDGDSVAFAGPFTTNMLVTTVEPVGTATLNISAVRRIKAKLKQTSTLPSGAPLALLNKSIYISGTVGGVAFTFGTTEESEFQVFGPNAVFPASGSEILLQLQIANLFRRIDMSSIAAPTDISAGTPVPTANPCPTIDPSAADLYTCFRKGLETESNLGVDNGDDELDQNDDVVD